MNNADVEREASLEAIVADLMTASTPQPIVSQPETAAYSPYLVPAPPRPKTNVHWFKLDCLRLHDNPAFNEAVTAGQGKRFRAIFIVDPWFNSNDDRRGGISVNVMRFLLESLTDLDNRLRKKPYCAELRIFTGQPTVIFSELIKRWNISLLTFQASQVSTEAAQHDETIKSICMQRNVKVSSHYSHTLFSPVYLTDLCGGKIPTVYKMFRRLLSRAGRPSQPACGRARLCHSETPVPVQRHHRRGFGGCLGRVLHPNAAATRLLDERGALYIAVGRR